MMRLSASLTLASALFGFMAFLSQTVQAQSSNVWTPNTLNDPEYKGCYASGALSRTVRVNNPATMADCRFTCYRNNYSVAGLRANTCYCGTSIKGGFSALSDSSCGVDSVSGQANGGAGTISVFGVVPSIPATMGDFTYQGCYFNDAEYPILEDKEVRDHYMTLNRCSQECVDYSYFGVESAIVCRCGNDIPANQLKPDSDCDYVSYADPAEYSGGYMRTSVYKQPLGKLPATAKALGCFADDYMPSLYYSAYKNNATNTPLGCLQTCSAKGFPYSGIQNGSDCYCGLNTNLAYAQGANATGCTTPCTGSSGLTCGGDHRVEIAQDPTVNTASLGWWGSSVGFKRDV